MLMKMLMKSFEKKFLLGLVLCGTMTVGSVAFANCDHGCAHRRMNNDCQVTDCLQNNSEPLKVKSSLETRGEIVAIEDDLVTVKGRGDYELISLYIYRLGMFCGDGGKNKPTVIYDTNGKKLTAKDLTVGMKVHTYYNPQVARSYPGRSIAKAIIIEIPESENRVSLLEVESIISEPGKNYVTLGASNNDLIASVGKRAYKDYKNIKIGDEVLVWYGIMTMSLPPRTGASKAIVL